MKFIMSVVLAFMTTLTAHAWEPTGPITVVIPSSPNSLHAAGFKSIENALGVEIIYEFRQGSAGIIGTNHFMGYPADGLHVMTSTSISHVMGEVTNPDMVKYSWSEDFEFTSGMITSSIVIAVQKEETVNTLEELLAWIESSETPLNLTTTFPNQMVAINLMLDKAGIPREKVNFVKYRKSSEAVKDVAAGIVDVWVGGMPPTVAFYESGDIKYVAVMSRERLEFLPDVETVNETFPGIVQMSTVGVLLPKGTPQEIVDWYEKNISAAVLTPEAKAERDKRQVGIDESALNSEGLKAAYHANRKLLEPGYREIFGD